MDQNVAPWTPGQGGHECLSTPNEVLRIALRMWLRSMNRGLGRTGAKVRQSPEAREFNQALCAMDRFLREEYDPTQLMGELHRLAVPLRALAKLPLRPGSASRCDPIMLQLYAMGDLPWRQRGRKAGDAVPLHWK